MKKLKCKAFLHLVFSPRPAPTEKRLKYLKQFTGVCTKGMGFFFSIFFFSFLLQHEEKNRQDEHKCIFTFRKNCRPSGSKSDHRGKDWRGLMLTVRCTRGAGRRGWNVRLHVGDAEALRASTTWVFLVCVFFFSPSVGMLLLKGF